MTDPNRPRRTPIQPDPLAALVLTLGGNLPSVPERQALKAIKNGNASAGQQHLGLMYILRELCGLGRSTFDLNPRVAEFRTGAQAVAHALVMVADIEVLRLTNASQSRRIEDDA